MLVEVDDRVMFVDEPNGARAVLRLRDPVANRITSHVRLLNRHYNRDPLKTASAPVSPGMRRWFAGSWNCTRPMHPEQNSLRGQRTGAPVRPGLDPPDTVVYQRGSLRREGPRLP